MLLSEAALVPLYRQEFLILHHLYPLVVKTPTQPVVPTIHCEDESSLPPRGGFILTVTKANKRLKGLKSGATSKFCTLEAPQAINSLQP